MGFGKDGKGQILYDNDLDITLGAMVAKDVVSQASSASVALQEDFRIIKLDYFAKLVAGAAEGANIIFGIASGALTAAEIEECLEADPVDVNDVPASERVQRAVWPIGQFSVDLYPGSNEPNPVGKIQVSGEKTLRWTFPDDDGWQWWAYNRGSSTLTTGGRVEIFAKYYGVWVR